MPYGKVTLHLVLTRLSYEETKNMSYVYFKQLLIKESKKHQSQGISQSYGIESCIPNHEKNSQL